MIDVNAYKTELDHLLVERNQHLAELSALIEVTAPLFKKIKKLDFKKATLESKPTAQMLHKLIKIINEDDAKISNHLNQFKKNTIEGMIESNLNIYKESLEKVNSFEAIDVSERGMITLTKIFYDVHKKKHHQNEEDKINLSKAKFFAKGKYDPERNLKEAKALEFAELVEFQKAIQQALEASERSTGSESPHL